MSDTSVSVKVVAPRPFEKAWEAFKRHECESASDVCDCEFEYRCPRCNVDVIVIGEAMPELHTRNGVCDACYMQEMMD